MKKMILGLILLTGLLSCSKSIDDQYQTHKGQCGILIKMYPNGQYGATSEYTRIIDVQFSDGWVGKYEVEMFSVSGQINQKWCN